MIFSTIWERYLTKETLKVFFFCSIGCFFLFTILFYSLQATEDLDENLFDIATIQTLFYEVVVLSPIILPVSLSIAVTYTLYNLQQRHELAALLAGGLNRQLLLRPFLIIAVGLTILLYLSFQFVYPQSLAETRRIKGSFSFSAEAPKIRSIPLPDGSTFIFQKFDKKAASFHNLFWIQSPDKILHMNELTPFSSPPKGSYVQVIERDSKGALILKESIQELDFPQLSIEKKHIKLETLAPDELSLSSLSANIADSASQHSKQAVKLRATLWTRLMAPLAALIAIFLPSSLCLQFRRRFPIFLISCTTIFGMLFYFVLLDTLSILAEGQFLPMWLCFLSLPVAFFTFFTYRFTKMT